MGASSSNVEWRDDGLTWLSLLSIYCCIDVWRAFPPAARSLPDGGQTGERFCTLDEEIVDGPEDWGEVCTDW